MEMFELIILIGVFGMAGGAYQKSLENNRLLKRLLDRDGAPMPNPSSPHAQ